MQLNLVNFQALWFSRFSEGSVELRYKEFNFSPKFLLAQPIFYFLPKSVLSFTMTHILILFKHMKFHKVWYILGGGGVPPPTLRDEKSFQLSFCKSRYQSLLTSQQCLQIKAFKTFNSKSPKTKISLFKRTASTVVGLYLCQVSNDYIGYRYT